jgi:hypothetical protein
MPETTVTRSARGISPVLLVLAALCFLLPFVGVSCNTAAGGAALQGALSQLGGSSSTSTAAASCLHALNGKDLVTYTGVNLLTGGKPSTATSVPGCDTTTSSAPSSTSPGGIGVQPLMVLALILIIVGVAASVLPARLRSLLAGGTALIAALLVAVNNSSVHGTVLDSITKDLTRQGGSSLSDLGVSASVGSFFDVHAAIGFTLILVALLLAVAVNAAALVPLSRPAPATGSGSPAAPPGPLPWPPPPDSSGQRPPPGPSPPPG